MQSTTALIGVTALFAVSRIAPLQVAAVVCGGATCQSALDCNLNGDCSGGSCACNPPWTGNTCGSMGYKVTPASGKNLYNSSDPRNTWNGPIVTGPDGKYHLFDPLYKVGSLGGPPTMLHGTADVVTGPYDWSNPELEAGGENPASVTYTNSSNVTIYTIWMGGRIRTATNLNGPWKYIDNAYPGGNPAPIYHMGAWYLTNQATYAIFTTKDLVAGAKWEQYATIDHTGTPGNIQYHVEDPYMWVDKQGNWHIVNHAYANMQYEHCGTSVASAHFFSQDGKTWKWSAAEPYSHTVEYDDGTTHTFTTLERPNIHFDQATGDMTHINLAVDLVTGDEGCGNRTRHAHNGHTPCDNCKWDDHAGTAIIALDTTHETCDK